MNTLVRRWVARAMAAGLALVCALAQAQDYPSRPLKLVVGFAPGGSADILGRIVAQKLNDSLRQSVVVENRPGAGGTIAAAAVAAAPADGYTLLFVSSGHAGTGALYSSLPYDPEKSFAPVIGIAASPVVIVVNGQSPNRSLKELVAAARKNPGKLNYAAGGGGATLTNLAAEVFKSQARVEMVAVPYKGSGPALAALLGGEVDCAFDIVSSALGQVKSGKLRALAVTSKKRSSVLPDTPAVGEEVLPGFDVTGWFGILVPAGTPAAVAERLNREIDTILHAADVKERLVDLGSEPLGGGRAEFGKLIAQESARWGGVIRRLGLKAN